MEGFLTLMVELRRVFGNDLDKVMILSAIGQQVLRDPGTAAVSYEDAVRAPPLWRTLKTTNIDALARATGIPRESVRRKVNELMAAGLVVRDAELGLTVARGAAGMLSHSTDLTIGMLDRLVAGYLEMLVDRRILPLLTPAPFQPQKDDPDGTT